MKTAISIIASFAMAIAVMPIAAQQTKSADGDGQTRQTEPNPVAFDKQLALQENMNAMQEQMNKVNQTQDARERQRLLQEHWNTMQDSMVLMHGIRGAGMLGGGALENVEIGLGQMSSNYGDLAPEQLAQSQYMLDLQLRLHQTMMGQIMQHYYWMGQLRPAPKAK